MINRRTASSDGCFRTGQGVVLRMVSYRDGVNFMHNGGNVVNYRVGVVNFMNYCCRMNSVNYGSNMVNFVNDGSGMVDSMNYWG